jgi:hypothetical protein
MKLDCRRTVAGHLLRRLLCHDLRLLHDHVLYLHVHHLVCFLVALSLFEALMRVLCEEEVLQSGAPNFELKVQAG